MLNKNIPTLTGIIIIVVVAVFSAGILIWQEGLMFASQTTPTIKTDETANWKTYRNEQYGFEIKYPSQWGNVSNSSDAALYQSDSAVIFNPPEFKERFLATGYPFLEMKIKNNPQKLDVENFYFPLVKEYETKEMFKANIVMNKIREISYYQIPTPWGESITTIPLESNFLEFSHHSLTSGQEGIFNQMLSTFRFLK